MVHPYPTPSPRPDSTDGYGAPCSATQASTPLRARHRARDQGYAKPSVFSARCASRALITVDAASGQNWPTSSD
jgi:hypothetical protein